MRPLDTPTPVLRPLPLVRAALTDPSVNRVRELAMAFGLLAAAAAVLVTVWAVYP